VSPRRRPRITEVFVRRSPHRFITFPSTTTAMLCIALACTGGDGSDTAARTGGSPGSVTDSASASATARPAEPAQSAAIGAPADSEIPAGKLGVSIRRGRALLTATRDSLPAHVGNKLRCTSCHLDEGRRTSALPLVGVYGRFPQYRSRNDAVSLIEDRINDCFERSMNGSALPYDSQEMRDMVAYMAFLSRGVAVGADAPGKLPPLPVLAGDTVRGAAVFAANCTPCHGARGEGTAVATPLWGPGSYNIGAGMGRVRTAAAFIRHNMPFGNPTLTDQQAYDVAAYVDSRPRPDFRGKEKDWPRGDPPADVPYRTLAAEAKARAATKP
jgi:thiosulfate dehydrogenase